MFNVISMQHGAIWGPVRTEKAPISNAAPKIKDVGPCKTTITFKPSASYPFLPSPDINYDVTFTFEVVGKDKVKVTVEGSHNRFPDYEGYVDGPLIYQWGSPSSGPGIINLGVTWRNIPKTEKVVNAPTP